MLISCLGLGKEFMLSWTAEKTGSHPTEPPPRRPCPPLRSDWTMCSKLPCTHACPSLEYCCLLGLGKASHPGHSHLLGGCFWHPGWLQLDSGVPGCIFHGLSSCWQVVSLALADRVLITLSGRLCTALCSVCFSWTVNYWDSLLYPQNLAQKERLLSSWD